jgi:hypothetical protein
MRREAGPASPLEVDVVARAPDRSFRSLSGLERTASTSRVLNLAAVASQNAGDPEYEASPFFKAAALNGAVIIKHRVRNDEQYIFEAGKRISTKVIIPFERTDLSLGGRSLFVGQRGWQELLNQLRWTSCRPWTRSCCASTSNAAISRSPTAISRSRRPTWNACSASYPARSRSWWTWPMAAARAAPPTPTSPSW